MTPGLILNISVQFLICTSSRAFYIDFVDYLVAILAFLFYCFYFELKKQIHEPYEQCKYKYDKEVVEAGF